MDDLRVPRSEEEQEAGLKARIKAFISEAKSIAEESKHVLVSLEGDDWVKIWVEGYPEEEE